MSKPSGRTRFGSKRFALIGAAGYVAPRHMRAIKDTGHAIVAALDPHDSVGIIDSYFPDASFFVEFERFDRHVDKLRRRGAAVDFVSITSPNYLHDSHIRFALRSGADVICEKPLVLNPWNIDGLKVMEDETGGQVSTILQTRLHPEIQALRHNVLERPDKKFEVDLTYITSRGKWYSTSWKADVQKSGGVATNIGLHFFDMLHFVFGKLQENFVYVHEQARASGYLEYERARVRWFLSVDADDLPREAIDRGQRTWRSITVDDRRIEFSGGFADLHTRSYEAVLAGDGFGLDENRDAIETVAAIRTLPLTARDQGERHPKARKSSSA